MGSKEFNLADLFEVAADTVPDRLALVAGPVRLTYRQLDERANRFAHHLIDSGIPTGAHVGILAHNRAEWAEAMVGCYKARVVPVNLNFRYVAPELRYVIDNADLVALVFSEELAPLVAESIADPGDPADGADGGAPDGAGLHLVVLGDSSGLDPSLAGAVPYEKALAAASPERGFPPRSPDDIYVLYTGGTTGMPKGVLWRQEDIFFAAMGGGGWGGTPITAAEELAERINPAPGAGIAMLAIAPLMHGNAQWVMWNGFMMGATVVLYTERRYDPHAILRLITDERVVSVALVGDAMARPLVEALAGAAPGTYDITCLAAIGSGGAMLSATVKDELRQQVPGVAIMDSFGSSESGAQGSVVADATGPRFQMRDDTTVLDEDLVPLTPGDGRTGRLARSGRVPLGYYKDPAKSATTFPVDARGVRWSMPGDLATIEADGTITLFGRGSASINSGGEKIFPEEVEAAVKSHPGVYDAIVVGVADDRFGERVAVLVRPRDPTEPPSLESIQEHCRTLVAGYKIPRQVVLVEAIPLTAAGKPDSKAAKALL